MNQRVMPEMVSEWILADYKNIKREMSITTSFVPYINV
jgi:hypothetical protein